MRMLSLRGAGRVAERFMTTNNSFSAGLCGSVQALRLRWLRKQVRAYCVPSHMVIALNCGVRYETVAPHDCYWVPADKIHDLMRSCDDVGVPAITFWIFAPETIQISAADDSGFLEA